MSKKQIEVLDELIKLPQEELDKRYEKFLKEKYGKETVKASNFIDSVLLEIDKIPLFVKILIIVFLISAYFYFNQ